MQASSLSKPTATMKGILQTATLALALLPTFLQQAAAQGWEKSYPSLGDNRATDFVQTPDLGFLMVGYAYNGFEVIKTDADGALQWAQNRGTGYTRPFIRADASNQGWAILYEENDSLQLLMMGIDGVPVWQRPLGLLARSVGLEAASGGGWFVAYEGAAPMAGVIRLDSFGEKIWGREVAVPDEYAQNLEVLPDGSAYLSFNNSGNDSLSMVKISPSGDLVWQKQVGWAPNTSFSDLKASKDGNLLFCGSSGSAGYYSTICKMDTAGHPIWQREKHLSQYCGQFSLLENGDGTIFTAGSIQQNDTGYLNASLVAYDPEGGFLWQKNYGYREPGGSIFQKLLRTHDGGLALAGELHWIGDAYLVKTDSVGSIYSNHILARAFRDENGDCLAGPSELPLPFWSVEAVRDDGKTYFSRTDSIGNCDLQVDTGSFTVNLKPLSGYWSSCTLPSPTVFQSFYKQANVDLGASAAVLCPLLTVDAGVGLLRRCFDNQFVVKCCNIGTADATDALVEFILDPFFTLQSADLPFVQNGNTVQFALGTLPVGACKTIHLEIQLSCDAAIGQEHCLSVFASPDSLCLPDQIGQQSGRFCQKNVGSFDPNDKMAFPEGVGPAHWVHPDSLLTYEVRFQNTGNFPAERVVIKDTLSAFLDLATLSVGAASHPLHFEVVDGRALKFVFDSIELPDKEHDEPHSHGFVRFSVRPKPGLADLTRVENRAAIYFDLNPPVLTNLVFHTLIDPIPTDPASTVENLDRPTFPIFPNPTEGFCSIGLDRFLGKNIEIEVADVFGKAVLFRKIDGLKTLTVELDLDCPAQGVYLIKIAAEGQQPVVKKLIVNKL